MGNLPFTTELQTFVNSSYNPLVRNIFSWKELLIHWLTMSFDTIHTFKSIAFILLLSISFGGKRFLLTPNHKYIPLYRLHSFSFQDFNYDTSRFNFFEWCEVEAKTFILPYGYEVISDYFFETFLFLMNCFGISVKTPNTM